MKIKRFLVFFLLTAAAFALESESDFDINGYINGIFDNLENKYSQEESGTIYGTNSSLTFGYLPDTNSAVFVGINYSQKFGDDNKADFSPLLAYKFENETNNFIFGTEHRLTIINYHDYVLSKRWQYENPIFQGTYFSQDFEFVKWAIWADWTGLKSKDVREEFIHGHNFSYILQFAERNSIDFGWQFIYNHIASRDREFYNDAVEDIGALVANIIYCLDGFVHPKFHAIKTGVRGMLTYDRQRDKSDDYDTAFGIEGFAGVELGIFELSYSQYFKIYRNAPYEYNLKTSDDRFLEDFGQADINVCFLDNKYAKISFTLSFIATDSGVNHRQTMQVVAPNRAHEIKKYKRYDE
jgi:hypothetical protein